jgi:HAD superfamily PSPase-like hydrolase
MNEKLITGFQAIAFDLDGVLVEEPSSWWTLHKAFGTYENSKENLSAYEAGEIDYPEFMRRDIGLWGVRTIKEVESILGRFTLTEGAPEMCRTLKSEGYWLLIVSAGIDILTEMVAKILGIDEWISNGLEVNRNGVLTGEGIFRVDLIRKDLALKKSVETLGLSPAHIIAVGDSKYDVPLMRSCGEGIAFIRNGFSRNEPEWAAPYVKINRLKDVSGALSKIQAFRVTD